MSFLTKLFKKKSKEETPTIPSWETVVEMMYDKHLDAFSALVVLSAKRFLSHLINARMWSEKEKRTLSTGDKDALLGGSSPSSLST